MMIEGNDNIKYQELHFLNKPWDYKIGSVEKLSVTR